MDLAVDSGRAYGLGPNIPGPCCLLGGPSLALPALPPPAQQLQAERLPGSHHGRLRSREAAKSVTISDTTSSATVRW